MKEKHIVVALILLLLPLSFGENGPAGTKSAANDAAGSGYAKPSAGTSYIAHGFTPAEMAALVAAPKLYDDLGGSSELFVSSFDATAARGDVNCEATIDTFGNAEADRVDAGCFTTDNVTPGSENSAAGFPVYDAFSDTEKSEYSRSAGVGGSIGIGLGGGGGGSIPPGPGHTNVLVITPEPETLLMLACGLFTLVMFVRRRVQHGTVSSS